MPDGVAVRTALPDDRKALASLAGLDSAQVPHPPILLATVNNNLRAAMSLADGTVISDPFYPTGELVELLHARAAELAS